MLGAIIGDIIGSYIEVLEIRQHIKKSKRSYEERIKILDPNTPLFTSDCSYTDDSVLTCAIADAVINDKDYEKYLRSYGLKEINLGVDKYGRSRFGKGFTEWLKNNIQGTSFGNGSAMRISPIGFYFDSLEEVKRNTYLATIPSHNSEEAIKGAMAISTSIYLLRNGCSKEDLKKYIVDNFYSLDFSLNDLQRNYTFSSKCSETVPQAIFCFLSSNSFEDAIRKCLSIGGDADTIACIVGGLAESYYGLDERILKEASKYIPLYIKEVANKFYNIKGYPKVLR